MVLTPLQRDVVRAIASNRSDTSYVAGGLVLNSAWPRQSDDIDIFQDTDEEVGTAADKDIATLRGFGFDVSDLRTGRSRRVARQPIHADPVDERIANAVLPAAQGS